MPDAAPGPLVTELMPHAVPSPRRDRRLPPIVPVIGIGATLGLGAVLVWSFTDTLSARDRYVEHPTAAGYHDGVSKESRTYGLIGGVAALGVATLAVAIFATNWHARFAGGEVAPRTLAIGPRGGSGWRIGLTGAGE
jgi:hypothetical protein